jgi:hypothetical protein
MAFYFSMGTEASPNSWPNTALASTPPVPPGPYIVNFSDYSTKLTGLCFLYSFEILKDFLIYSSELCSTLKCFSDMLA